MKRAWSLVGLSLIGVGAFALAFTAAFAGSDAPDAPAATPKSVLDFTVKTIDGKDVKLADYRGDVLLIVNVASQCGLTDRNYTQLEPLYKKYQDQGFRILAFPANNFNAQEPGTDAEIKKFCTKKYAVTFDLFSKVSVKGDDICPLYDYLTHHPDKDIAGPVMWNFQKYVVDRDGQVIAKFDPRTNPEDEKLTKVIEKALTAPRPDDAKGQ